MNTRQEFWDERYRGHERLFGGNPNAVLVAEVADLKPGRALDVGCGEGADALWLARNGWHVTAIDIAPTALHRAAESATAAADTVDRTDVTDPAENAALADGGHPTDRADVTASATLAGRVTWTCADLAATPPPAAAFDLVSAQYFPLPRTADHAALRALLAAVAPGGTLLVVSHDLADIPPGTDLGLDPADFYQPADIADLLADDWTILTHETRPRLAPAPPGTHHAHDIVLRAVAPAAHKVTGARRPALRGRPRREPSLARPERRPRVVEFPRSAATWGLRVSRPPCDHETYWARAEPDYSTARRRIRGEQRAEGQVGAGLRRRRGRVVRRMLRDRGGPRTPWMLLAVAGGVLLLIFLIFLAVILVIWLAVWIAQGSWVPHPAG